MSTIIESPEIEIGRSAGPTDTAWRPDSGLCFRFSEPACVPAQSYAQWFRATILRSRWLSWFATLYVHWLIVLLLAVLIVHGPEQLNAMVLNCAFSLPESTDIVQIPLPEIVLNPVSAPHEQPISERLAVSDRVAELSAAVPSVDAELVIPAGVLALAKPASDSPATSAPAEEQHALPTPPSAVILGNFSVWTEPDNPDPGQPYRIVIQIRLPEGTRVYPVSDLEGVVVGSDGYRKPIPGSTSGTLPIQGGSVRYYVPVVSADEKVEDTILIRSKMLKETQKLLIRF